MILDVCFCSVRIPHGERHHCSDRWRTAREWIWLGSQRGETLHLHPSARLAYFPSVSPLSMTKKNYLSLKVWGSSNKLSLGPFIIASFIIWLVEIWDELTVISEYMQASWLFWSLSLMCVNGRPVAHVSSELLSTASEWRTLMKPRWGDSHSALQCEYWFFGFWNTA